MSGRRRGTKVTIHLGSRDPRETAAYLKAVEEALRPKEYDIRFDEPSPGPSPNQLADEPAETKLNREVGESLDRKDDIAKAEKQQHETPTDDQGSAPESVEEIVKTRKRLRDNVKQLAKEGGWRIIVEGIVEALKSFWR